MLSRSCFRKSPDPLRHGLRQTPVGVLWDLSPSRSLTKLTVCPQMLNGTENCRIKSPVNTSNLLLRSLNLALWWCSTWGIFFHCCGPVIRSGIHCRYIRWWTSQLIGLQVVFVSCCLSEAALMLWLNSSYSSSFLDLGQPQGALPPGWILFLPWAAFWRYYKTGTTHQSFSIGDALLLSSFVLLSIQS